MKQIFREMRRKFRMYPNSFHTELKKTRSNKKSFWLGHFTPKQVNRFLIKSYLIYAILILLAFSFYSNEKNYHISKDMISYLGDYTKNSGGWVFFSIACIIQGVFLFPLAFYSYRRLLYIRVGPARFLRFSVRIAAISMFLIGFFPDVYSEPFYIALLNTRRIHYILAIIYLSSTFSAQFCFSVLFFQDQYGNRSRKILSRNLGIIPIIFNLFIFIGTMFTQTYALKHGWNQPFPGIYALPIWEWMIHLNFLFLILLMNCICSFKIPEVFI